MLRWLIITFTLLQSTIFCDDLMEPTSKNSEIFAIDHEQSSEGQSNDQSTRWWFLKKVPATLTLESSSNPALLGQTVIYTTLVKGTTLTPTGIVTFEMNGHPWGKAVELDEQGHAVSEPLTVVKPALAITVHYSGDKFYDSGSLSLVQNIVKTTPLITVSSSHILERDPRTSVNVTVTGTNKMPSGTVTLTVNGTVTHTPKALDERGQVSVPVQLTLGQHSIIAFYSGDDLYNQASSKSLMVNITGQPKLKHANRLQR